MARTPKVFSASSYPPEARAAGLASLHHGVAAAVAAADAKLVELGFPRRSIGAASQPPQAAASPLSTSDVDVKALAASIGLKGFASSPVDSPANPGSARRDAGESAADVVALARRVGLRGFAKPASPA